MKKSVPILLTSFSSLVIFSLIFQIVLAIVIGFTIDVNQNNSPTYFAIQILSGIIEWTCFVGTFVSSIIMLVKTSKLSSSIGYFKATSILGIIASCIFILIKILNFIPAISTGYFVIFLSFIWIILMIVVFGMSIPCILKLKRMNCEA